MKKYAKAFIVCGLLFLFPFKVVESLASEESTSCLDGFCIGQSIKDVRFDNVDWILPAKGMSKQNCSGVGCKPEVAFYGYSSEDQVKMADAVSWTYGAIDIYNVISKDNIDIFRHYRYECNRSAPGNFGERRFIGAYLSDPSKYLTIVGLRLVGGDLKVYRIARQYPFHNQSELISLAQNLRPQYGEEILFYDYLSSNAYSDVIAQSKGGWFARSTMFTPNDLSKNAAELVLIDPKTRKQLVPSSMPESGEIEPIAQAAAKECFRPMPIE
ncbi:MAG: hypothetical protein ABI230_11755 [Aestuariivirga sp.]